MGKRTADAERTLTNAIRHNDELRALKGRARLDATARLAESDKQLEFLAAQVEQAKQLDAQDAAAAHAERLKVAQSDVVASRQAEKLAASIDTAVTDLVERLSKLADLIFPRFDRAKRAVFESNGLPALIHKIELNRYWVGHATGADLQAAISERSDLNREYTLAMSDMEDALRGLETLHFTSPAAAQVIANINRRIQAAWSREPIPAAQSLADVHANATADLEKHVQSLQQKGPQ